MLYWKMKRKLIIRNILSHFCKAMSQMFYFEDPRVKENWRIFSDKLYKKLVDDHSKKADDFAAIFEVEKFCDGIL